MTKKIAIVGSRDVDLFKAHDKIDDKVAVLKRIFGDQLVIVSGGARGVDRLAESVAHAHEIKFELLAAHWKDSEGNYNRRAGLERNLRLVEAVDMVIAFWDGKSKGTKHTIETARRLDKPLEVVML